RVSERLDLGDHALVARVNRVEARTGRPLHGDMGSARGLQDVAKAAVVLAQAGIDQHSPHPLTGPNRLEHRIPSGQVRGHSAPPGRWNPIGPRPARPRPRAYPRWPRRAPSTDPEPDPPGPTASAPAALCGSR